MEIIGCIQNNKIAHILFLTQAPIAVDYLLNILTKQFCIFYTNQTVKNLCIQLCKLIVYLFIL